MTVPSRAGTPGYAPTEGGVSARGGIGAASGGRADSQPLLANTAAAAVPRRASGTGVSGVTGAAAVRVQR
jgi:hypothetical protein